MGVYYRGVVAVGVQRGSIEDFDAIEELTDSGKLEIISPSYDGYGDDDAVVGLVYDQSDDYSSNEFNWDQQKVDELKATFNKLTGMEAKVWIMSHGY